MEEGPPPAGEPPQPAAADLRGRRLIDADEVIMNLHLAYFRTAFDLGRATAAAAKPEVNGPAVRCNCEARRERNREAARATRKRAREQKEKE